MNWTQWCGSAGASARQPEAPRYAYNWGLALCKRILEAHEGTIELEPSERGASFLIVVPDGEAAGADG